MDTETADAVALGGAPVAQGWPGDAPVRTPLTDGLTLGPQEPTVFGVAGVVRTSAPPATLDADTLATIAAMARQVATSAPALDALKQAQDALSGDLHTALDDIHGAISANPGAVVKWAGLTAAALALSAVCVGALLLVTSLYGTGAQSAKAGVYLDGLWSHAQTIVPLLAAAYGFYQIKPRA